MVYEQGLWHLRLSVREVKVLILLLEGLTIEEVARVLALSCKAVEYHLYEVKQKLNIDSDIQRFREASQPSPALVRSQPAG